MTILDMWYSPPLTHHTGTVAMCGARWIDDDGAVLSCCALLLDGAFIYENIERWPKDVLYAVVAFVSDKMGVVEEEEYDG